MQCSCNVSTRLLQGRCRVDATRGRKSFAAKELLNYKKIAINLHFMGKDRKPLDRTAVTAAKFREIAAAIRSYANLYDEIADAMEKADLPDIPVTGIPSLEKRSLTELRGNAMKAMGTFMKERDAQLLASVAGSKQKYVVDDGALPKKPRPKARKKDGGQ